MANSIFRFSAFICILDESERANECVWDSEIYQLEAIWMDDGVFFSHHTALLPLEFCLFDGCCWRRRWQRRQWRWQHPIILDLFFFLLFYSAPFAINAQHNEWYGNRARERVSQCLRRRTTFSYGCCFVGATAAIATVATANQQSDYSAMNRVAKRTAIKWMWK